MFAIVVWVLDASHFLVMTVPNQKLLSQVLEVLENSVSKYPEPDGRFLQVGGIEFSFDPSKASGNRINQSSIKIDKNSFDLEDVKEKIYTKFNLFQY